MRLAKWVITCLARSMLAAVMRFGTDPDLQFVDLFYCEHTHPPTRPQYCRSHSWSRPTAGLVQFLVRQRTAISNSWAHPTAGFVQILVLQWVLGACSRPPAPHRASPSRDAALGTVRSGFYALCAPLGGRFFCCLIP